MKTRRSTGNPLTARTPLLAVTTTKRPKLAGRLSDLDALVGGAIARAIRDREISGKAGEVTVFHNPAKRGPLRIAVVGVGAGESDDDWVGAGRAVARAAARIKSAKATLLMPDGIGARDARTVLEAAGHEAYRFDRFRTRSDNGAPVTLTELTVAGDGPDAKTLAGIDVVTARTNAARDLSNTPANHLTPSMLAAYAQGLARGIRGLTCTVLGPRELQKLGAGALLAVGQGSVNPPQMIVLRWKPARARRGQVLGIVGKAVTFDTGGISIKPANGMEEMKMDMSGGAAAIESIAAIAQLGLPVEVIAVIPSAENMPDGNAIKPGDVVTAMNGKTIEVINTDAEGRLILADGLTYAARNGATHIVEFATLTGAMVVALGEVYAGLFGSDQEWSDRVNAAGTDSGDLTWPMPLHERYRPLIKSAVADLSNAAKKRQAGAVYAAMFLREFTEGVPWCHIDIAGTATPNGAASGFGVRLVTRLAEGIAAKR